MIRSIFKKIFPNLSPNKKRKFSYFDKGKKIKKINL